VPNNKPTTMTLLELYSKIDLKTLVLACALVLVARPFSAQSVGTLDPGFGLNGQTFHLLGDGVNNTAQVIELPDGRILNIGYAKSGNRNVIALMRFSANGVLDPSFNLSGIKLLAVGQYTNRVFGAALQADGKIVAAGHVFDAQKENLAVFRFNPDGLLDSTFNQDGVFVLSGSLDPSEANHLAVQSDQKIVVAGITNGNFTVYRFLPNGTLDNGFGVQGKVTTTFDGYSAEAFDVLLQPNGRIVVIGNGQVGNAQGIVVARYLSNGQLDPTFNGRGFLSFRFGTAPTSIARDAALQTDGKILISGVMGSWGIARINSDGSFDSSFGPNGTGLVFADNTIYTLENSLAIALQPDGKIISTGAARLNSSGDQSVFLFRLLPNGQFDPGFGTNGRVLTPDANFFTVAQEATISQNGKLLVGGIAGNSVGNRFLLQRYGLGTTVKTRNPAPEDENDLLFFPNPFTNALSLKFDQPLVSDAELHIVDVHGKLIVKQKLPKMTKQADLKSVDHLPAGVYFAKISTAHQAMGQKIVKN
jgi:uncharacterized delta-60 repeat protein